MGNEQGNNGSRWYRWFWTTIPGILTGLAAIITAIGSCIIALIGTGGVASLIQIFGPTETPVPTIVVVASPTLTLVTITPTLTLTPTPTTKPIDTPQPPAPAIPPTAAPTPTIPTPTNIPTPTPTPTVPPPRGVSFYREGDDAPFLTETGELCKVLRENMDKVEIPEWYFARLDLPEGSIVRVENAETGQQRDLQVVIRHDVRDCVIGFGQDNRTLLGLPEDLGELGDPRRYGHSIKITLYSP